MRHYSSVRRTLVGSASTMRPGPLPTHHVLERSSIKLLSDGLSEGRYRPPAKLGTIDLIAVPGCPLARVPIWGLANPKLGEREVTKALLEREHRLIQAGQVILGDKGFAGRDFERFITKDLGATLIRPDRKDEKPRFGRFGGIRQWIESVFDTLKGQLGLEHHGGRTLEGVYARVASKLLALASGIWHTGTPTPVANAPSPLTTTKTAKIIGN